MPLLLIPEYSGINKDQRIPDRSKTAHRKPPVKCFLTHGWMDNKDGYTYTMEHYSDIKKNKIMAFATWMDLEIITLSEVSQTEKDK